jgi:hypothetical protein
MIDEVDLAAQLSSGNQQTAEEFAAQVKNMSEQKVMESANQDTLTVFSDIALFHGFAPALAANLLAEAGRDFELDAEWTPEDAILVSNWLREAQAKKRRSGGGLSYEPDTEGASHIPTPSLHQEYQTDEKMYPPPASSEPTIEPEVVPASTTVASAVVGDMDLSINFDTAEQIEEFLKSLKETGVSLGKPGSARVVMKISSYAAQVSVWQDL